MPRYEGRLELTWTNKDQCLLARDDGSYEWLPPSDYRVAEVRLLERASPWISRLSADRRPPIVPMLATVIGLERRRKALGALLSRSSG